MIKVDQALISAFIDSNFGYPIAHENQHFEPQPGQPYFEIYVLPNDLTPLTISDTDETDGVFRVVMRFPENSGAAFAKSEADYIFSKFPIGKKIEYEGQQVLVTRHNRQRGINEGGWYVLVLSIGYRAFIRRIS